MFSEIFSPYEHVWPHYLGNKEPIFPACIPEQVYAAILESSKNNDLFQSRQNYSRRIPQIFMAWFCKTANVRMKRRQAKMEGTYCIACYQL